MKRRTLLTTAPLLALAPLGVAEAMNKLLGSTEGRGLSAEEKAQGGTMSSTAKVYELRIYHVVPGKMDELVGRFRDHTDKLFASHGMKSLAYWSALDEPEKSSTFFYILEHPSREAATANWKAFQDDPAWKAVKEKTEANGKLVEKVDSTFWALTDFSPKLS
jgi:hypothetical protein